MMRVYIKPGCPWCVDVVGYLRDKGYSFEEVNVIADPDAFAEMRELSGQSSAPTITVGDLLLADCGVEELVPFLAEHGLEPGS